MSSLLINGVGIPNICISKYIFHSRKYIVASFLLIIFTLEW